MAKQTTPSFEQAAQMGFTFPGSREWFIGNAAQLAQDAAMITTANTTVPVELTAYIDPMVIEIMTAPRNAREVFGEVKKGDWTTSYDKWRTKELIGRSQAYSDFASNGVADVNNEWNVREQYIFQTVINYGDLESAISGVARIQLASEKQQAAARTLDIDANAFYLRGVVGMNIYGILNDPNLPAAITPLPAADGTTLVWSGKSTVEIWNDIRALFKQLADQSAGIIRNTDNLILLLSPGMNTQLAAATDFNIMVEDMAKKFLPNLKIVVLPELSSATAGETCMLIAPDAGGQQSGVLAFGEKVRAMRIVPELSSLKQKWISSTYGGIVLQPYAFATMTGI